MSLSRFLPFPLSENEIEKEILNIRDKILQRYQPSSLYVFGSAANHRMNACSDFDFLLVFDSTERESDVFGSIVTPARLSEWPVDLLCIHKEDFEKRKTFGGVCFEAYHRGRLIYDRLSAMDTKRAS